MPRISRKRGGGVANYSLWPPHLTAHELNTLAAWLPHINIPAHAVAVVNLPADWFSLEVAFTNAEVCVSGSPDAASGVGLSLSKSHSIRNLIPQTHMPTSTHSCLQMLSPV